MNRTPTLLVGALLGVLGLTTANAQAGILWSYDWTQSTAAVTSDGGKNEIDLTLQPSNQAGDSSDIVAANMQLKTPVAGSSDSFTHRDFSLVMHLTDNASKDSATLTFTADFDGTITPTSSQVKVTFHNPVTQEVKLGGDDYKVTMGPYTPLGPVGGLPGSIGAHVDVVQSVPEPATALLLGVGGALLGMVGRGRKRIALG